MIEFTIRELSGFAKKYDSERMRNLLDMIRKMGYDKVQFRDNDFLSYINELIDDAMEKYIDDINAILADYDFLLTGCKENPDMMDEYQDVSKILCAKYFENKKLTKYDLMSAFDKLFEYNILYDMGVEDHTIQDCVEKIIKILNN